MLRSRDLIAATMLAGLIWPASSWAADNLADGKRSLAAGDLRTAQIQLRNAVKDNPKSAEANYRLGLVSLDLGDSAGAEKDALSAQNLGYDVTAAQTLVMKALPGARALPGPAARLPVPHRHAGEPGGNPRGPRPGAGSTRPVGPGGGLLRPSPQAGAPRGGAAAGRSAVGVVQKDLPTARQKVQEALAIAPNSADALQRQAALLGDAGDRAGAIEAANKAVAAAPGHYAYRLSRASLLLAFNQDAAAKADVDAVLASVPNNAQATYDRAVLLTRTGDFKGADVELQKLSEYITPTRRPTCYSRSSSRSSAKIEQAIDAANRYVARSPGDPKGALLLAEINLQIQQYNRAIDVLTPSCSPASRTSICSTCVAAPWLRSGACRRR